MKLKSKIQGLLLAAMLVFGASQAAMADMISIGVSAPLKQTFKDADVEADGTSGYMLEVELPMMIGLGYESYTTKIKDDLLDVSLETAMYDVFYSLDLSLIKFTLGLGLGEAVMRGDLEPYYKIGRVTQTFWRIGIPFAPFFGMHVGQHGVNGKLEGDNGNTNTADIGSKVTSLGITIGF